MIGNNKTSRESAEINLGLRQGCSLSSQMFNIRQRNIKTSDDRKQWLQNTRRKNMGSITYANEKVLIG